MRDAQTAFTINREDDVVAVSDSWGTFAEENGGDELTEGVIGKSLWTLLQDDGAAALMKAVLKHVRSHPDRPFSYLYRCDSPEQYRLIRMVIFARQGGNVEFVNVPESRGSRDGVVRDKPRKTFHMCDDCLSLKADGEWMDIRHALTGYAILKDQNDFELLVEKCGGLGSPSCKSGWIGEVDGSHVLSTASPGTSQDDS